jgi:iron complex transport system ATP-binding protein
LVAENLSCGYGARTLLSGLSFELVRGHTLCLLGPNGSGKTTLFKTMLGMLRPHGGRLLFNDEDTAQWSRRRFAQTIAYIPQDHFPAFSFTAFEVVLQGRTPKLGALSAIGAQDEAVAHEAMASLGISSLERRDYTQLSGGERQMVLIARALAQQPAFLVMDEPTASLDLGNQARVLERILEMATGSAGAGGAASANAGEGEGCGRHCGGLGVMMTTHDPNQASLLGGKVACIGRDRSFSIGRAQDALTPDALRGLYGVDVALAKGEGDLALFSPILNVGK